jgi:hypothetical protein
MLAVKKGSEGVSKGKDFKELKASISNWWAEVFLGVFGGLAAGLARKLG